MDFGVVHPVPLAVHDVVSDLEVLEDLGQGEQGDAGDPEGAAAGEEEGSAAGELDVALGADESLDVADVLLAEV